MNVFCCVHFCPLCGLTKYTVVGTALSIALAVGKFAIGPGDSQALFSPGHWHRSLRSGPRTAVVVHLDPLWDI